MSNLRILFAAISAIVLFLFGPEAFSREIQAVGGDTLRKWLGRLTESRWRAVVLDTIASAIIQSSSAAYRTDCGAGGCRYHNVSLQPGRPAWSEHRNDFHGMAGVDKVDRNRTILHRSRHCA